MNQYLSKAWRKFPSSPLADPKKLTRNDFGAHQIGMALGRTV